MKYIFIPIIISIITFSSCDFSKHHVSNQETIEHKSLKPEEKEHILNIDTNNLIKVEASHRSFYINERKSKITRFECSKCHSMDLELLKAESSSQERTHSEIKLDHSNTLMMECTTCHTGNNMNVLHNINQNSISFDESYKLCAQCHSDKLKSWQGGAHGKRIGNWAEPRISKTCVECHNPHKPAFPKKYPERHFIESNQED